MDQKQLKADSAEILDPPVLEKTPKPGGGILPGKAPDQHAHRDCPDADGKPFAVQREGKGQQNSHGSQRQGRRPLPGQRLFLFLPGGMEQAQQDPRQQVQ